MEHLCLLVIIRFLRNGDLNKVIAFRNILRNLLFGEAAWGEVAIVIRNDSGRTWKRAKRPGTKQQKNDGRNGCDLESTFMLKFYSARCTYISATSFFRSTKTQTIKRKGWWAGAGKHSNRQDPQYMAAADIRYEMRQRENRRNCQDKPLSQ